MGSSQWAATHRIALPRLLDFILRPRLHGRGWRGMDSACRSVRMGDTRRDTEYEYLSIRSNQEVIVQIVTHILYLRDTLDLWEANFKYYLIRSIDLCSLIKNYEVTIDQEWLTLLYTLCTLCKDRLIHRGLLIVSSRASPQLQVEMQNQKEQLWITIHWFPLISQSFSHATRGTLPPCPLWPILPAVSNLKDPQMPTFRSTKGCWWLLQPRLGSGEVAKTICDNIHPYTSNLIQDNPM